DLAALALLRDSRREIFGEGDAIALLQPLGGPGEGAPFGIAEALMQQDLDARLAAPADQPGGNDARIVEDQEVAGCQQLRQIAHAAVLERAADHEQPRRVPRL